MSSPTVTPVNPHFSYAYGPQAPWAQMAYERNNQVSKREQEIFNSENYKNNTTFIVLSKPNKRDPLKPERRVGKTSPDSTATKQAQAAYVRNQLTKAAENG